MPRTAGGCFQQTEYPQLQVALCAKYSSSLFCFLSRPDRRGPPKGARDCSVHSHKCSMTVLPNEVFVLTIPHHRNECPRNLCEVQPLAPAHHRLKFSTTSDRERWDCGPLRLTNPRFSPCLQQPRNLDDAKAQIGLQWWTPLPVHRPIRVCPPSVSLHVRCPGSGSRRRYGASYSEPQPQICSNVRGTRVLAARS